METVLFKNDAIEIIAVANNLNFFRKAVICNVKAVNPFDGKVYEKYAGWISSTMALHGGSKTPGYVFEAGLAAIKNYEKEIRSAMIAAGKDMLVYSQAGNGVSYKVAHPPVGYRN